MVAAKAQVPITTIPTFGDAARLPECAKLCGPLYDANGACVPPAAPQANPAAYTACFCSDARVSNFAKGTAGVCDQACAGAPNGLQSIAGWFQSICTAASNPPHAGHADGNNLVNNAANQPGNSPVVAASNRSGGGDWLSNHWQWVIMLVILVVGIAGIWIGACIWRRRYLRKKDRQTSLDQKQSGSASNPTWGPAVTGSDSSTPIAPGHDTESAAPFAEKPMRSNEKRTWRISQRT